MKDKWEQGDWIRWYDEKKGFYVRGKVFDVKDNGQIVVDSGSGVLRVLNQDDVLAWDPAGIY